MAIFSDTFSQSPNGQITTGYVPSEQINLGYVPGAKKCARANLWICSWLRFCEQARRMTIYFVDSCHVVQGNISLQYVGIQNDESL